MKKKLFLIITIIGFIVLACEKDTDNVKKITLEKLNGYVQKGPFLNGTSISISELTDNLVQTGLNFSSQILDNQGTFEIEQVEFNSQYVELKADGYYFNEVNNDNSSAQLTLYAISDLKDKSSLNVNILSTLERSRIKYLISNGSEFIHAKKQAQNEILSIFEIYKNDIIDSELLDITKSGDDNAILLAVSVILQGYLSVSELSELLANISTDIREDGTLNSQILGTILINNAKKIKTENIRQNLEKRYETLGLDITIPEFEKYIRLFIDSTNFIFTDTISYPEYGAMGENILYKNKNEYNAGPNTNYVIYAILPEGSKLKIDCINWSGFYSQENTGWNYYLNRETRNFYIETYRTGEVEMKVSVNKHDVNEKAYIHYYENDDTIPSYIKEIIID